MFNEGYLQSYLDTAIERHRIYKHKEAGDPKPWSSDPVYQRFFFCNLFRQYDKCTDWIIQNVLWYERWDLIILYRFISTYELFEEIKQTCALDDLKSIEAFLASKRALGHSMFNGCFLRNPRVDGGWVKTYQVPFITIEAIRKDESSLQKILETGGLQELCEFLKNYPGIGGFMAYEYACDLEYSEMFYPRDKYTWANMGPGARRGISLLLHGVPGVKVKESEWLESARELWKILKERVNKVFPGEEDVSMREVEHWLCEFQKYSKYRGVLSHGHRVKFRTYGGL